MITLGINAALQDSAAALVIDGVVIAAAEEERYTRVRHAKRALPFSAWELPFQVIDACLASAGIGLGEVDHVAYSYDPQAFYAGRTDGLRAGAPICLPAQPDAEAPLRPWDDPWDGLFAAYLAQAPRQLAAGAPHALRKRFMAPGGGGFRWHYVNHHLCHQASACLAAPFERCAVMTLDGRGECATTTYGAYGETSGYRPLGEVLMPHSLGLLVERVTAHLGFPPSADECPVMTLAALGTPRHRERLEQHLHIGPGGQYRIEKMDLAALFGPARAPGAVIEQRHLDVAASLQETLENTALDLARWLRQASGETCLAIAGDLALNCAMNARLRDSAGFDAVWVQPAAGDAGTALGAALWIDARERQRAEAGAGAGALRGHVVALAPRRWRMEHAYLGPDHDDAAIEALLREASLRYRRPDDLADATAGLLAEQRIVGWFQGRMAFGPRALGARAILASPVDAAMRARVNALKGRADASPLASALPREELAHWLQPAAHGAASPLMLFVDTVAPAHAARIPAVCHGDRMARMQSVDAAAEPRLHALLQACGRRSGVPVLINTAFKLHGEPIVCTPRDAIRAYFSSALDALAIGPFLLEKEARE